MNEMIEKIIEKMIIKLELGSQLSDWERDILIDILDRFVYAMEDEKEMAKHD